MGDFKAYFGKVRDGKSLYPKYRQAILDKYGLDINGWKPAMDGRFGDEIADVVFFPLDQILDGIEVEKEHTPDVARRLEIALDHLDEDPEYYTKLKAMEGK